MVDEKKNLDDSLESKKPLTPQLKQFLEEAKKSGLIVEPVCYGYRVHSPDKDANSVGLYGLGVDIMVKENGGFHSATRLDVDLSITTTIRTLKEVRKLFSGVMNFPVFENKKPSLPKNR